MALTNRGVFRWSIPRTGISTGLSLAFCYPWYFLVLWKGKALLRIGKVHYSPTAA